MTNILLFIIIGLMALVYTAPITNSFYWEPRELKCVYYGGNNTRCALHVPQFVTEQNPGCFDEVDKANRTRVYCGLSCEESDETTIVKKQPQWNHQCSMFYTYNLERRRKDWYLWRSGVCINTTMTFEILCGTFRDPRLFYFHNERLFDYEDSKE